MKSRISEATGMKYQPVCIIRTDEKPDGAMQFKKGRWGCIMWLLANAARGEISCCDRDTFGCVGGGVGMGFGNQYKNFIGGEECFHYFLSTGNKNWAKGRENGTELKQYMNNDTHEEFINGEGYLKSPDLVRDYVRNLPITEISSRYVVFKPIGLVDSGNEIPEAVIFLADADQLSALVVLANYARRDNESVIVPFAAGCQTIGIYPYNEMKSENPRAVIGLTDISARVHIRKYIGDGFMTFTVPFSMFEEMESNVEGSFLERSIWNELLEKKQGDSDSCPDGLLI